MDTDKFLLRTEKTTDHQQVFELIKSAFQSHPLSNHKEQHLVRLLRNAPSLIPSLSIVAVSKTAAETVLGHILLTPVDHKTGIDATTSLPKTLALAPLTVSPNFQGKGIGSALIIEAHSRAKELGYSLIVLVGNPNYYQKFGYKEAASYAIKLPYDLPSKNCLACVLNDEQKQEATFNQPIELVYPDAFKRYLEID
jgi:predicted N-acetyltransferase YhbS